ncbi:MAG: alpha-ketoglutarate-dependent dioxygenase AlkB [Pigmentiphaga sp.]|uniref:alpha-ketoglutarate-dependent dioxygenase AlkB n=1 Tax=Pigmentiphaga sp. TaxID=1977564 RepID=UPI0029BE31E3|nr:alpha-ketoglutarate-dependent dioxygenase AlkB [Pigmentiphaga sp.]MDX3905791.1 alpha-ketoglutarate-dependent dioxygenase AlkB [Pigmentiphaga sp.]
MEQPPLFDLPPPPGLLEGLTYEPDFLSLDEAARLEALMATLPFAAARYKNYTARRRVVSYGGSFDYDVNRLQPAQPLIPELHGLRDRVAHWLGVPPQALVHVLVAEYAPGAPLGWHRDVPDFQDVVGISLGSDIVIRFRPYPPVSPRKSDIVRMTLAPRSIYLMRGPVRWEWQHSIAPAKALRWSITFRTASAQYRPG